MTMVCLRFLLTTVVLNAILRITEPSARLRKKDALPLLASGLLGVTVYFFFESRGIKLTSASHASLIISSIPIFTVLAELLFFHGRLTVSGASGIALSVAGVFLVVYAPGSSLGAGSVTGDLFMFGACISWVAYIHVSKNLHKRLSDLAITAYQSLFGTLFLIPLAFVEYRQWVPLVPVAVFNLLYLALFSSAAGNFLYIYGLSRLGPIVISPFVNLIPVVGVLGGMVILGETVGFFQLIGGAVIIGGVLLVSVKKGKPREDRFAG
jgi:drug/metabolite transporter (DMT)-like permease